MKEKSKQAQEDQGKKKVAEANFLREEGKLEEAINAYQEALEIQPDNPEIYRFLGMCQFNKGEIEGAIISYQKAIDLNKDLHPRVYLEFGNALEKSDQIEQAQAIYHKALKDKFFMIVKNDGGLGDQLLCMKTAALIAEKLGLKFLGVENLLATRRSTSNSVLYGDLGLLDIECKSELENLQKIDIVFPRKCDNKSEYEYDFILKLMFEQIARIEKQGKYYLRFSGISGFFCDRFSDSNPKLNINETSFNAKLRKTFALHNKITDKNLNFSTERSTIKILFHIRQGDTAIFNLGNGKYILPYTGDIKNSKHNYRHIGRPDRLQDIKYIFNSLVNYFKTSEYSHSFHLITDGYEKGVEIIQTKANQLGLSPENIENIKRDAINLKDCLFKDFDGCSTITYGESYESLLQSIYLIVNSDIIISTSGHFAYQVLSSFGRADKTYIFVKPNHGRTLNKINHNSHEITWDNSLEEIIKFIVDNFDKLNKTTDQKTGALQMREPMKENQSNTKSIPEKETSVGINIALGKPASQSSRSKWSKPDDPQGAVNGIKTGSFGFHTDFEIQPWWQVDLENLYEISQIKIFNRENAGLKCADRAKSLSVFTSIDGMTWEVIHKQDQSFGGYLSQKPLLVECNNKVARFVRIQLNGKNALHLDEVEIYGIPFQAEGSQFSLDPPKTFNFIDYKGQLLQDKWVVMMTKGKQKGVFLEIGSTDGVELNNTFCLEKNFSWSGICVEPNPDYFRKLCVNRTAITLPYAFYKQSGQIVEFVDHGVLGTISDFLSTDLHASSREKFVSKKGTIKVITACPEDILNLYKFPDNFDFLSLDVEGAELDVLEAFNLSKWHPALACVEHNYVADKRLAIFELLSSHGYQRIQCGFDDWYYNLGILQVLNPEIPLSHYKEVLEYFCVYHHCKLVDEASFHNAKSLVKEKVSDSVVINEINPNSAQLQSSSGSALSATETSKDGINLNPNPNLNLALNKPTAQSSVYQPEQYGYDPQGACNGKKNGKFGFCTLKENQPWWQIDLQEIYQLSEIRIYNRINCKERASTLDVLLSQDALNWELCYSNAQENLFGGIDGNPLIADMQQKFTRFVRLQLRENEYLHLDEVEIYGSPFQPDGSGLKSSQNEATLAANFYGQAGCLPPSPSPDQIKQIALKSSKGIIHVGAHKGQEAEFYASNNKSVIWVEALPQVFATLEKKVAEYPNQQAINALVTDTDGKEYKFNISNNSVSSSLFEFGDAKDNLFPQLKMVDSARLVGKTLSTIYREFNIDGSKFDFLLLDVQGAELMVLKGAESVLHNFKYILAEISTVNIYKNGVLWDELKTFLNEKGFKEAISVKPSRHCDVLFIRETGGKIEN